MPRTRTGTVIFFGAAAALSLGSPALAAAQAVNNDYGQTAAAVTAEINAAAARTPAVAAARQRLAARHASTVSAVRAEAAAKKAYAAALSSRNAARIATAKKAYAAAKARSARARAAEKAAAAALAKVVSATRAAIRAKHYVPQAGTWTGAVATYVIEGDVDPIQVRVVVGAGRITSVTVPQYVNTGDSGEFNRMALPQLITRALAAQDSAVIAKVSGASLTSKAFSTSLHSALLRAGYRI